jgi:hypothetical protein
MGLLVMYLILMKCLRDPHVKKPKKNIVGMGMHKIIKQIRKVDLKNRVKTVTPENG